MGVSYKKHFDRQFKRLPAKVQERFYERLALFMADKFAPLLNNHSVEEAYPGCRSINVTGDCRAIFYEAGDLVMFVNIGTHSELYG